MKEHIGLRQDDTAIHVRQIRERKAIAENRKAEMSSYMGWPFSASDILAGSYDVSKTPAA